MKVAIIGSWRREDAEAWGLKAESDFFEALRSLGSSLAHLGHRLVVATNAIHTADRAAVDGALRALTHEGLYHAPVVEVLRGRREYFRDLAESRPGFVSYAEAAPTAEVAKLYQVRLADVVFAAGGAEKTLLAIVAAAASGKRIVPLGSFGGAARKSRAVMKAMSASWGPNMPNDDMLGVLSGAWSPKMNDVVLTALGVRAPQLLIVHGRDLKCRDVLIDQLVRMGHPKPMVMGLEPDHGLTLPEKFERLALQVDAAIALVTPDDVGGLKSERPNAMRERARQNVWVEVGWFWGRLNRARVLLLGKGKVEMPSDLSGLLVKEFTESPAECDADIRQWIESMGWPRPTGADPS